MHFSSSNIRDEFFKAITDYFWLMEKKYPQKAILKLIGDRYKLTGTERSILYRGIFTSLECEARKEKLTQDISDTILHIDTYNVLITIGSYLNGNVLYVSNDNFLRDASEIHGKVFRTEVIDRAINLLFDFLKDKKVNEIIFYIDKPISHSAKLKQTLENNIAEFSLKAEAKLYQSPDHYLKKVQKGIIATSDSVIIDKSNVKIIDLAFSVLNYHFQPTFVILHELLKN